MAKKGGETQTVTTGLDPQSQAYVEQMRKFAQAGLAGLPSGSQNDPLALAGNYMNPYEASVIAGTQADYDRARMGADAGARQEAAAAGAFGDERASLMRGSRLGSIDRAEAQDLANLRYSGYNNALNFGVNRGQYLDQLPYQQMGSKLGMYGDALGPTGQTTTTETQKRGGWGDWVKGAAGIGLTLATGGAAAPFLAGGQALNMLGGGGGGGDVSNYNATGQMPSLFNNVRLGSWGR